MSANDERTPARRPRLGERYRSRRHGLVEVRAIWQNGALVVGTDLKACLTWTDLHRRFERVTS